MRHVRRHWLGRLVGMILAGVLGGACGGEMPTAAPATSGAPATNVAPVSSASSSPAGPTAVPASPATTVTPAATATLLPSPTVLTRTARLTDATGDLFDGSGKPTSGSSYLDIVSAEILIVGSNYIFRMTVNGPVPAGLSDSNVGIEWDFFIDADGPATGWSYPIVANDIGPDYMVSLNLRGSQTTPMLLETATNKFIQVVSKVSGNTLEISFNWDLMQRLERFDCVVAVRQWQMTGPNTQQLAIADKAPDQGHGQLR